MCPGGAHRFLLEVCGSPNRAPHTRHLPLAAARKPPAGELPAAGRLPPPGEGVAPLGVTDEGRDGKPCGAAAPPPLATPAPRRPRQRQTANPQNSKRPDARTCIGSFLGSLSVKNSARAPQARAVGMLPCAALVGRRAGEAGRCPPFCALCRATFPSKKPGRWLGTSTGTRTKQPCQRPTPRSHLLLRHGQNRTFLTLSPENITSINRQAAQCQWRSIDKLYNYVRNFWRIIAEWPQFDHACAVFAKSCPVRGHFITIQKQAAPRSPAPARPCPRP